MKIWGQFPILLTLECVEMSVTTYNITSILLNCMAKVFQLKSLFHGGYALVVMKILYSKDILKSHIVPFLIGVHCMAHKTNLTVVVLSKLPLVSCI
jgi:hypothetical protein